MTRSQLHQDAVRNFSSTEVANFERLERELTTEATDGSTIVANLRLEAHLVGDRDFGDPEALSVFLQDCGTQGAANYSQVCKDNELKGLRIPDDHLPAELVRYVGSDRLAADLIERFLGDDAKIDFNDGRLALSDAFANIASTWGSSGAPTGMMLARDRVVWSTCSGARSPLPKNDARAIRDALALPDSSVEFLLEFRYPTHQARNKRFPTVADAGKYTAFRPAPEKNPDAAVLETVFGWTFPVRGGTPQPEIVHDNQDLQILTAAPRFVGRLP